MILNWWLPAALLILALLVLAWPTRRRHRSFDALARRERALAALRRIGTKDRE